MRLEKVLVLRARRWAGTLVFGSALLGLASTALAQSEPAGWNLSLSVREARVFDATTNGQPIDDRTVDGATAGIGYARRSQRSSYGFSSRVGLNRRQAERSDNRVNYGANFNWNYRTSERSQMGFRQSVSRNFRLDTLATLGVIPSDVTDFGASTNWSFQHQPGRSTSWSTSLGYGYRQFNSGGGVEASQIVLDEQPFGDEFALPVPTSEPAAIDLTDDETDALRILATEGLAAGRLESHQANVSFGLSHALSSRTQFGVSAAGSYRTIESNDRVTGPRGGLQASLNQRISTASAIGLGYSFQRALVRGPAASVQTLSLGWSFQPTNSSVRFSAAAGASHLTLEGRPSTTSPVANASFSAGLTGSTSVGVSYRRQFTVPLGFGRSSMLIDFVSVSLSQNLGSRASASVRAGASLGQDPNVDGSRIDSRRVGGNLSVRVLGPLSAGTTYFYTENERRTDVARFDTTRHLWSVFLNFSASF